MRHSQYPPLLMVRKRQHTRVNSYTKTILRLEYLGGIATNQTGTCLGPRVSNLYKHGSVLARLSDQSFGDEGGWLQYLHQIAKAAQ